MFTFSPFLSAFRRLRIRRSAICALNGLSSEQLADLGIAPDHIAEAVDGLMARNTSAPVRPADQKRSAGSAGARARVQAAA